MFPLLMKVPAGSSHKIHLYKNTTSFGTLEDAAMQSLYESTVIGQSLLVDCKATACQQVLHDFFASHP